MVSPEASDGVPRGAPPRKARKGQLKVTVGRRAGMFRKERPDPSGQRRPETGGATRVDVGSRTTG